ncbi:hypothetical protein K488DRAFT_70025 [Vararia minispora EC-137]|uniref:Uncharacterized protein n=1 Tax=Vararia minispora EC-137 TaxID=1314806 RepID=A0ACB8QN20_9AGAM|nr:hypothetical protein K488DRAFT_70025 [Vararia minispora EC-137]
MATIPSSAPGSADTNPALLGNITELVIATLSTQFQMFIIRAYGGLRITYTSRHSLVYICFVLEFIHTVAGTDQAWHFCIVAWGKPQVLAGRVPWSVPAIPGLGGFISCLVQLFYAWRIWVLSHHWFFKTLAIFTSLLSLAQCGAAFSATVLTVITGDTPATFLSHVIPSIDVWLSGSFVVDFIIASCMIWKLHRAKQQSDWTQSRSILNRLIIRTIQTGLLTAVIAAVDLFLWVHYRDAQYHLTAALTLGKLLLQLDALPHQSKPVHPSEDNRTSSPALTDGWKTRELSVGNNQHYELTTFKSVTMDTTRGPGNSYPIGQMAEV